MQTKREHTIPLAFLTSLASEPAWDPSLVTGLRIGQGLINFSYRIQYGTTPLLFLQRINTDVFPEPAGLVENYLRLYTYTSENKTGIRMPEPVCTADGKYLLQDDTGETWRAFEFIQDATCIDQAESPAMARTAALTFARLTESFSGFDASLLVETIPRFHDLGLRFQQFEDARSAAKTERLSRASEMTGAFRERKKYVDLYQQISTGNGFIKRVMHHDAKIGNILFHADTGDLICLVDFDTVMPGYFFSDLGDLIRSMACSDSENTDGIPTIRPDIYEAVINGYTEVLEKDLTDTEKKYLHAAGLIMIYMQGLRFLADYLNGDIYYQTTYPEQNFDRAANQLGLLGSLENFLQVKYQFRI